MPNFHNPPGLPRGNDKETVRKRIQMRTIARFEACEAARKAVLDAGKSEEEAHEAAKAIWNGWAAEMLARKKELKEAGQLQTTHGVTALGFAGIVGSNDATRDWLEESTSSFSFVFLLPSIGDERRRIGKSNPSLPDTEPVSTFNCVSHRVDFSKFRFPGAAWFENAAFGGEACFDSTKFEGVAWFMNVSFEGAAGFHSATFKDDARFHKATFKDGACFDSAVFKCVAGFNSVVFKRDAQFMIVTFEGAARFHGAIFAKSAWFFKAAFVREAWFESAKFEGDAWFESVSFKDVAAFPLVEFSRNVKFRDTHFEKAADFNAIDVKRAFDMADATFETQVPNFIHAHFTENPRLDNVTPPKLGYWKSGRSLYKDDPARYRALLRMAEQAKDHDREHAFFKGQMRADRKLGGPLLGWVLSCVYDALSDYGRSFIRPLFALGVVWLVFAGVYGGVADMTACPAPQGAGKVATTKIWCPDWYHAGGYLLSMTNSLPAVSAGQRQSTINAQVELFGGTACVPKAVAYLGVLQTLLSVILLFLAALGLRNMFRIK